MNNDFLELSRAYCFESHHLRLRKKRPREAFAQALFDEADVDSDAEVGEVEDVRSAASGIP